MNYKLYKVSNMLYCFLTISQAPLEYYYTDALEVEVGLHELLGHGSGKLFKKDKDGSFNFNIDEIRDLETGEKVLLLHLNFKNPVLFITSMFFTLYSLMYN